MMCNYHTLLNQVITEVTAAPINMFPKYKFNDTDPKTNAAIYPAYHKGGSFTNRQYLLCLLRLENALNTPNHIRTRST